MGIDTGDEVQFEYVGRYEDGTIFDTSREEAAVEAGIADEQPGRSYEPLSVEIGEGEIIEGLETELVGMDIGDEATVTVPPEAGYGHPSEDRIVEYDIDTFAAMLEGETPREGLVVRTQDGTQGEVVDVGEDAVRIDFNHRLAGETLQFEIEIVDING